MNLSVDGRPSGPGETSFARWRSVTPGFFRAAGVRLLRGRGLEPADFRADAPAVVVVTEAFAASLFPGRTAARWITVGLTLAGLAATVLLARSAWQDQRRSDDLQRWIDRAVLLGTALAAVAIIYQAAPAIIG